MNHLTFEVKKEEYGSFTLGVRFADMPTLTYDLSDFFKDTTNIFTLYDSLNEYFSTMPVAVNEEIYMTFFNYKKSQEDSTEKLNDRASTEKLENRIAKVIRIMDYTNFKLWLSWQGNRIHIPENVTEEFLFDPDMNITKEKTYIRNEYIGLVGLSLIFRALVPMFIDYYNYIRHLTDYFYYKIMMLFIKSDLYISEEMDKLREYVENIYKSMEETNKRDSLILNNSFSSDEIVDTIIAEVIFTKLITNDFFNKKNNMVSFIFQTIKYKINFAGMNGPTIRNKTSTSDDKDDISYFEDYRKTSEVSVGTIAEIQNAFEMTSDILRTLGVNDFSIEEYHKELERSSILMNKNVDKIQTTLLGWLLHKYMNPRALYYVENKKLIELLTLAKIVLWKKNFKFLAVLMTSYTSNSGNYMQMSFGKPNFKSIMAKLMPIYTHIANAEKYEILEKTLVEIVDGITHSVWVPLSSHEELAEIRSRSDILTIPSNIYEQITDFILYLNDSNFTPS